jgi:hypothetical protein
MIDLESNGGMHEIEGDLLKPNLRVISFMSADGAGEKWLFFGRKNIQELFWC